MSLHLPEQIFKAAAQSVVSSTALVDITGFVVPVAVGQVVHWELDGLFTLGATGGFRFQPTCPAGITDISSGWYSAEAVTPTRLDFPATTQTPFTNAAAVAATYIVKAKGSFTVGATAGNFSMQFAQNNSTANAIAIVAGMTLKVQIA